MDYNRHSNIVLKGLIITMNSITIVVKVGTSVLTHENGSLNIRKVSELVRVLADLKNTGARVVLVTSGAVGVGMSRLRMPERPKELPEKQAAAAVGQSELMNIYSRLFSEYGHMVAQILLTLDVIEDDTRRKNAENTFAKLLELGVVPVVNENDTISTYEIERMTSFGENDTLSAIVARLVKADKLVLLSDIDGLYDKDPRKNADAKLIPVIKQIDSDIQALAGGAGSERGTGGMATKLSAAIIATQGGIEMFIINGDKPEYLYEIMEGKNPGTVFLPTNQ